MDPEAKQLLENVLSLEKENNIILHKIRGIQKRQAFWQVLKYILIIGIALGSFYFLEPYMNKIVDLYNTVSGTQQKLNSTSFQDLLKKF